MDKKSNSRRKKSRSQKSKDNKFNNHFDFSIEPRATMKYIKKTLDGFGITQYKITRDDIHQASYKYISLKEAKATGWERIKCPTDNIDQDNGN